MPARLGTPNSARVVRPLSKRQARGWEAETRVPQRVGPVEGNPISAKILCEKSQYIIRVLLISF